MAELEDVFSDLVRVETRLWNVLDARLQKQAGLTLGRFETMAVIERRGRCRAQDIAAELGITISGTSKLVDRIEAAAHCVRMANPDDGRSSLIELTPDGRTLLAHAGRIVDLELDSRLSAALAPDALRSFSTSLSVLRRSLYADDDPDGTGP